MQGLKPLRDEILVEPVAPASDVIELIETPTDSTTALVLSVGPKVMDPDKIIVEGVLVVLEKYFGKLEPGSRVIVTEGEIMAVIERAA